MSSTRDSCQQCLLPSHQQPSFHQQQQHQSQGVNLHQSQGPAMDEGNQAIQEFFPPVAAGRTRRTVKKMTWKEDHTFAYAVPLGPPLQDQPEAGEKTRARKCVSVCMVDPRPSCVDDGLVVCPAIHVDTGRPAVLVGPKEDCPPEGIFEGCPEFIPVPRDEPEDLDWLMKYGERGVVLATTCHFPTWCHLMLFSGHPSPEWSLDHEKKKKKKKKKTSSQKRLINAYSFTFLSFLLSLSLRKIN